MPAIFVSEGLPPLHRSEEDADEASVGLTSLVLRPVPTNGAVLMEVKSACAQLKDLGLAD